MRKVKLSQFSHSNFCISFNCCLEKYFKFSRKAEEIGCFMDKGKRSVKMF